MASAFCKGHGGAGLNLTASVVAAAGTRSYAFVPVTTVQRATMLMHGLAYCDAVASELRAHSARPVLSLALDGARSAAQQLADCVFRAAAVAHAAVLADCGDHVRCYAFPSADNLDLAWWRASTSHAVLQW